MWKIKRVLVESELGQSSSETMSVFSNYRQGVIKMMLGYAAHGHYIMSMEHSTSKFLQGDFFSKLRLDERQDIILGDMKLSSDPDYIKGLSVGVFTLTMQGADAFIDMIKALEAETSYMDQDDMVCAMANAVAQPFFLPEPAALDDHVAEPSVEAATPSIQVYDEDVQLEPKVERDSGCFDTDSEDEELGNELAYRLQVPICRWAEDSHHEGLISPSMVSAA